MAAETLFLCYGNPGRLDDGLGTAFAAALEGRVTGADIAVDYQLHVEDAADLARYRTVVFVDAAATGRAPFELRRALPGGSPSFSTHSVSPEALMRLGQDLFGAETVGYILGIRGYCFDDFGEVLSAAARINLEAALGFAAERLRHGDWAVAAQDPASGEAPVHGKAPVHGEAQCETANT